VVFLKLKTLLTSLIFVVIIAIIQIASGQIVVYFDASLLKEKYEPEQNVQFWVNITNPSPQGLDVILTISFETPENAEFVPPPIASQISLGGEETFYQIFERYVKDPGDYGATVEILDIGDNVLDTKKFQFEIISGEPELDTSILICKDQSCTVESKIFVKDETVYLDYSSDVDSPSITAILTYPDKTTRTLTLPTSIKAEQVGTHTLGITASKQGYQHVTVQSQFAVIEQEAKFTTFKPEAAGICNENGICQGLENYRNCPGDCPSGSKDNYCDGLKDGVCDMDCTGGEDPDCELAEPIISPVLATTLVMIGIVIIAGCAVFLRSGKKKERESSIPSLSSPSPLS
jgi:hypothetical protein